MSNNISKHKPRILAIAPYAGLASFFHQIKQSRTDMDMCVISADYEDGLRKAEEELSERDYDIIVSRGGTAQILRDNLSYPVLEIEMTIGDILHALKLAEAYDGKSAFVGFEAITKHAAVLCELLNYNMPVYTIRDPKEAHIILSGLKSGGYSLILCDTIVSTMAVGVGLTPVLITSTLESVEKIIDDAIYLSRTLPSASAECSVMSDIIKSGPGYYLMVDQDGEIVYSSLPPSLDVDAIKAAVLAHATIIRNGSGSVFRKYYSGAYYTFSVKKSTISENLFIAHIMPYEGALSSNVTKTYSGLYELAEELSLQPRIGEAFMKKIDVPEGLNNGSQASLITGEPGSTKDNIAGYIYEQVAENYDSFILIDMSSVDEAGFNLLVSNNDSPLNGSGNVIYMKNLQVLDESQCDKLVWFFETSSSSRENLLLFSASYHETNVPDICPRLSSVLKLTSLKVPPLRECRDMIPNLAIICINNFNARYSRQVISLTPEAMEMIVNYEWNGNMTQFYRVMKWLVQHTPGFFIQANEVSSILESEQEHGRSAKRYSDCSFDFCRHLEDITRDVVEHVVDMSNGSQSKAAEILGISRTTIWRILKGKK